MSAKVPYYSLPQLQLLNSCSYVYFYRDTILNNIVKAQQKNDKEVEKTER